MTCLDAEVVWVASDVEHGEHRFWERLRARTMRDWTFPDHADVAWTRWDDCNRPDELHSLNAQIEHRQRERSEEFAEEIKRLQARAAAIIDRRTEAALRPLEEAHEAAVAKALRLLGK